MDLWSQASAVQYFGNYRCRYTVFVVIYLSFKFGILEKLNAGEVLVGDGGMTHALEKRGYVKAGPYTPECTVEYPDAGCSLLLLHHRPQLWGLITTSLL